MLNIAQVVANAVAALGDIHEASLAMSEDGQTSTGAEDEDAPPSTKPNAQLFIIDGPTLNKLLVALNECSEWGRIAILNTLARYKATDTEGGRAYLRARDASVPAFSQRSGRPCAVKVGVLDTGDDTC